MLLLRLLLVLGLGAEASRLQALLQEDTASPAHPELCAPAIVSETCNLLSGEGSHGLLQPQDFQLALSAAEQSIAAAWGALKLPEEVACQELCSLLVAHVAEHMVLPPTSDVGCLPGAASENCTIDVSPQRLDTLMSGARDIPDMHDEETLRAKGDFGHLHLGKSENQVQRHASTKESVEQIGTPDLEYTEEQVVERLANLFRIFPGRKVLVDLADCESAGDCIRDEGAQDEGATSALLQRADISPLMKGIHGLASRAKEMLGIGCGSYGELPFSVGERVRLWKPSAPKFHGKFATVDCPGQTRGTEGRVCLSMHGRSMGCWSPDRLESLTWQDAVAERNVQAIAYVNTAARRFRARQTQPSITRWFGRRAFTDKDTRNEVNRVLNSIQQMLANVEFVYPGDRCSPNTYAYVFPHPPDDVNREGKFVCYLCDYFMASPMSEQIETLTHEASHHATAYTDDVCLDEGTYEEIPTNDFVKWTGHHPEIGYTYELFRTHDAETQVTVKLITDKTVLAKHERVEACEHTAYGRGRCQQLAQRAPLQALMNADNFCYYIQDILDAPN